MRSAWPAEIAVFACLLAGALMLGLIFGAVSWWLVLALVLYLAHHLRQLYLLDRWLRVGRRRNPPEAIGIWGDVFENYYRLQKRYYRRKKRLARVIRNFRESTEALPDGSLVLDGEWRILWFNQAAQKLLGLNGNRDLGQVVTNLVRGPRFIEYIRAGRFDKAMDIESPVMPGRFLSLHVIPYGEGQRLLMIRDVTRLKRLEAMRRDFVVNASHELRSPLTVLAGYVESIHDDDTVRREWGVPLEEMQRQCRRMTSLINDLLELSRLETEQPDAARDQPLEINGLAARIAREGSALAEGGRHFQIECSETEWLMGVESEIYSAFSNLVFNAVRYTREGGNIGLFWGRDRQGRPVFEVRDDGVGIAAKHIPFITQRFYRVDSARSRDKGGTGLGLAIVKHIMQRHGGHLEIESEVDRGSTFRCVFPEGRAVAPMAESDN